VRFQRALVRCALRLIGISPEEVDQIFRDIMSFVCTPIMFSFGFNRVAMPSSIAE
jgi:hypothetical protein